MSDEKEIREVVQGEKRSEKTGKYKPLPRNRRTETAIAQIFENGTERAYAFFARERIAGRRAAFCGDRETFPRARRETVVASLWRFLRALISSFLGRVAKCSSKMAVARRTAAAFFEFVGTTDHL
jgi:hypothetical protein